MIPLCMGGIRHIIYGLTDPTTGELRYIGRSSSGFRRPRSHWEDSKTIGRHDPCHAWIRALLVKGLTPSIEVLEEVVDSQRVHDELNELERFWIASVRASGGLLKNVTDGGDSFPDTRREKNWMFGRTHPSKGKRLNLTPEQRCRRGVRKKGQYKPIPETIRKIANANRGKKRSAETREKQRLAALTRWSKR